MSSSRVEEAQAAKVSPLYDPRVRSAVYQLLLVTVLVFIVYQAASNVIENLRAARIASGFGFWDVTAGFDINQTLINYDGAVSTYGRAFFVGLLNTLLVAAIGIVLATVLGFAVGIARLSQNWLIAQIAKWYVEVIRNIPLLLQLVFWYNAVLKPLPDPRNSLALRGLAFGTPNYPSIAGLLLSFVGAWAIHAFASRPANQHAGLRLAGRLAAPFVAALGLWMFAGSIGVVHATEGGIAFLNNRGLYVPQPVFGGQAELIPLVALLGLAVAIGYRGWAKQTQLRSGRQYPVVAVGLGLVIGLPLLTWLALAVLGTPPVTFLFAEQQRFNLRGGVQVFPEFVALTFGLVIYTAAFIAEIVRAGILAVSRGQTEAASALGMRSGPTLRFVVVPQALRIIIPPLTSQYLNLVKNSTLAVAIGYPDLVQIFAGTVLNQTGQAVEVIAITMAVYLFISLVTSAAMNAYNRRVAIVER